MLMTVKDNLNRIVYLEDDVKELDKRLKIDDSRWIDDLR